ncbi:MFS transporter [Sphingomonas solaris]|uniref:MFS transporter n=2 Tax=Alterirhizorhabdus solaris TaxID=2529389 RepID=A0A558QZU2_9SPHN|nr:MFS transporter [Sphingomonas solaris]
MPAAGIVRGTPAYRDFSIALLLAGFATFSLLYSVQPLLPLFTAEYGVTAEVASLAVSLATGPMAVALLAAGLLSDRLGRRGMMIGSLLAASVVTMISAVLPGWTTLLAMRVLTGVALAGIPAVAMAYIAEEVDPRSIGPAMGTYIAGTALGGMAGRLGVSVIADFTGWRVAMAADGAAALAAGLLFWRLAPLSRAFAPRRHDWRSFRDGLGRLRRDAALPWLYATAFLVMGVFVTIYNYAGFRLTAPPYDLRGAAVGAIFLLYILGSFSSTWFGGLADRLGRRRVIAAPVILLLGGALLTGATALPLFVAGIAIVTVGFFGAHSIASSWVGRRSGGDRAQAAAFYLCFYYLGSSILGSAGGFAWTHGGWHGVVLFCGGLTVLALLVAAKLATVRPLAINVPTPPPAPAG